MSKKDLKLPSILDDDDPSFQEFAEMLKKELAEKGVTVSEDGPFSEEELAKVREVLESLVEKANE